MVKFSFLARSRMCSDVNKQNISSKWNAAFLSSVWLQERGSGQAPADSVGE